MALITRLDGTERQQRILEAVLLAAAELMGALDRKGAAAILDDAEQLRDALHRARLEGMLYGR